MAEGRELPRTTKRTTAVKTKKLERQMSIGANIAMHDGVQRARGDRMSLH
jgi:hypothetical protein